MIEQPKFVYEQSAGAGKRSGGKKSSGKRSGRGKKR